MSRRLTALVIGNADYEGSSKLKNPGNDADDVAAKLEACGFEVVKLIDSSNTDLDRALKRFKQAQVGDDVGLFFFAGHGMQIDGENYLAALDTDTEGEREAKHSSLPLNRVIDVGEGRYLRSAPYHAVLSTLFPDMSRGIAMKYGRLNS
jgi:uncharacterized caspase-like protein